jgi:hypothetical protein
MWTEHDENDQEWVRTFREVDGKIVNVRIPLEQYEREQEAARIAQERQWAEQKAEEERQAAVAEQERRAAMMAAITPLQATLTLARRGSNEILPKLRQVLDEHPELWQHFGNLALQVQENGNLALQVQEKWLQLIAGKDLYLAESLRLHLDAMRSELAGPHPSPLDCLLVDRIVACHVQTMYADAMEATDPTAENMRVARYRMDRRDQAHKQLMSAVKTLTTVRNLVARTNVIQIQVLNPPMPHSAVAPIIAEANGDEPAAKERTMQAEKVAVNGLAHPVNRLNGAMNGHRNRFAGVLEPVTTE